MIKERLSAVELQNLERACSSSINWTDGGHWIGNGREPNCNTAERLSSFTSHTYHFPTDDSALQWNLEWERLIRTGGHL